MNPLEPAQNVPKTKKQIQKAAKKMGISYKDMKEAFRREEKSEVWMNDLYTVAVERDDGNAIWLSIRRNDREPITDWRHKQEIKNQLIGPECEAVELYPAESRLVDTANQFHLWGYKDPTFRFPIGFQERKVDSTEVAGSRQRPPETENE